MRFIQEKQLDNTAQVQFQLPWSQLRKRYLGIDYPRLPCNPSDEPSYIRSLAALTATNLTSLPSLIPETHGGDNSSLSEWFQYSLCAWISRASLFSRTDILHASNSKSSKLLRGKASRPRPDTPTYSTNPVYPTGLCLEPRFEAHRKPGTFRSILTQSEWARTGDHSPRHPLWFANSSNTRPWKIHGYLLHPQPGLPGVPKQTGPRCLSVKAISSSTGHWWTPPHLPEFCNCLSLHKCDQLEW